ncbi:hypothetical protein BC828DRAFT_402379 [Blastocladiella britannica]|nr:hypothetical protein BC828DRAFT_402379 [Blastocladiella britannica]
MAPRAARLPFFRILFVTLGTVGGGLVGFYLQDKAKRNMIDKYMKSLSDEELRDLGAVVAPSPSPRASSSQTLPRQE